MDRLIFLNLILLNLRDLGKLQTYDYLKVEREDTRVSHGHNICYYILNKITLALAEL